MTKLCDSMAIELNCTLVTAPKEHHRQQFKKGYRFFTVRSPRIKNSLIGTTILVHDKTVKQQGKTSDSRDCHSGVFPSHGAQVNLCKLVIAQV